MPNNEIITIEFKADIEDVLQKIVKIADFATSTFSSATSTIAKLSKGYLGMKDVGDFILDSEKLVSQFFNMMYSTAESGIHGFERLQKVIVGTTKSTKLATVAAEAMKIALSPWGLIAISTGIIAITAALVGMNHEENEGIKISKENLKLIKEQQQKYREMQEESKATLETSMVQIDLAQRYGNELLKLLEGNNLVAESQDRINFLVERLNELLPDAGFYYNEATQEIVDMNGEVIDLKSSLEDLIQTQKAQAYLNSYQGGYEEALKNKSELMKKQIDLYDEIQQKQAIYDQYNEKSKMAAQKYGYDSAEYREYMQEFFDSIGMAAGDMISLGMEIDTLSREYESGQQLLESYTNQIKDFEALQEAIFEQDWDRVNEIMNGMGEFELFDVDKGVEQIDTLQAQYDELERIKNTLEDMKNNNQTIDEDYLESVNEKLKSAGDELNNAVEYFGEEAIEEYRRIGSESGETLKESLNEKMEESGTQMIEQMKTDAEVGIEGINGVITSTTMNPVVIPVVYQYQNTPATAFGATLSMIGASYDDSMEDVSMFQPWNKEISEFTTQARNTIHCVQSRISSGILALPKLETQFIGAASKQVDVNQTNIFNVPVQKPSDVTKALEKQNRELAKKL